MDFFYSPSRLLHKDFNDFRTGGEDGKQVPTVPQVNLADLISLDPDILNPGTLLNYLGIPAPLVFNNRTNVWEVDSSIVDTDHPERYPNIDLKPINMYIMLWNEYFRDESLNYKLPLFDESKVYTAAEMDLLFAQATDYELSFVEFNNLFNRAWPKDYFTSALPDPQRGNSVGIPFAQSAGITVDDIQFDTANGRGGNVNLSNLNTGDEHQNLYATTIPEGVDEKITSMVGTADLSQLSTVSIIGLRTAFAIQSVLEKLNVSGGRLQEFTLAMFNEWVPDNRIQRPIRLSSSKMPVVVSEVETNAETGGMVVGDLAGKAKATGGFKPFKLKCVEDGYLMAVMTIMPKPAYLQGLSKMWTRFDRWDMYLPQTQFIGEQAIKNQELYVDWSAQDDYNQKDFGYQARFSEMKFNPDRIVGDMQTSLAYWHMARMFNSRPGLNEDFIACNPDTRPFAVSNESNQNVVGQIYFNIIASRKMARYATPKLT